MSLVYELLRPRMIQTLALLLAISYVGVAARRWRPAMLFDALALALVLWRPYPALLAFVLWLIGVRWVRGWATWVALAFSLDEFPGHTAALARFLLPAWGGAPLPATGATRALMSRSEAVPAPPGTGSATAGTGSGDLVPGRGNQAEPPEPASSEPPAEPSSLRNLSRQDLIVLLACQRKEDGDYLLSANAICGVVGGRAADVKDIIAAVRGPKSVPPPAASVPRPNKGW